MVNVPTQVSYWREGAREDWQVACELIAAGRIRHGFFFAHLALEKLLKARVCPETQQYLARTREIFEWLIRPL